MIDSDFEKQAALLTNDGYFSRVRQLCSAGHTVKAAWEQVESELPLSLRRFTTYTAFRYARVQESNNNLRPPIFKLK